LRIAKQDDALSCLSDGEDVCEGHLSGFVNDEHVDCVSVVFSGPQPRRTTDNLHLSSPQSCEWAVVRCDLSDPGGARIEWSGDFLDDRDRHVVRCTGANDLVKEVLDHGMADGRDADLFALADEVDDNARADVRLARTRRALDREDAVVEFSRAPLCSHKDIFAVGGKWCCRVTPGWHAQEEVSVRPVRSWCVDPVFLHPQAEAVEGIRKFVRPDGAMGVHAWWVYVGSVPGLLNAHQAPD
jgi:hypothetical protein